MSLTVNLSASVGVTDVEINRDMQIIVRESVNKTIRSVVDERVFEALSNRPDIRTSLDAMCNKAVEHIKAYLRDHEAEILEAAETKVKEQIEWTIRGFLDR